MEIRWKTVTGSQEQRPDVIDKTSSSRYVYLHRNIHQIDKTDDKGETVQLWQYEEAKITQEEYSQYNNVVTELLQTELSDLKSSQAQTNAYMQANIEYIAMMSDIDLEG